MAEIKCPNCGTVFQVDDSEYTSIALQVRDQEFERALNERINQLNALKENDIKLAVMEKEN